MMVQNRPVRAQHDGPRGASTAERLQGPVDCECCGGDEIAYVGKKRGYRLYHCTDCGLAFVWPQPPDEDLAALYRHSAGYFARAEHDLVRTSPQAAHGLQSLLSQHSVSTGHLLDVGCSAGQLMYHMRELGWSVTGVDINPDVVSIGQCHGLDVRSGTLQDANLQARSFDVVNMGDVLEHVRSPRHLLSAIHRLLRPGGLVIIRTPNATCSFARSTLLLASLGVAWPHSEAPYHLFEFTPDSLRCLLQAVGFELAELSSSGHRGFRYLVGASGWFDDLKRTLKRKGLARSALSLVIAVPQLFAVTALFCPFYLWSRAVDALTERGDALTLVGRRP